MNSRERIMAAVRHEPVDRVPVDLGGTRQSGISVFAYARLKAHLGLENGRAPRVYDVYQMLAEIEPAIAERFGADCVGLNRRAVAFGIPNDGWKPWTLHDGVEVEVPRGFDPAIDANGDWVIRRGDELIAQMPREGWYFDRLEKYPGALHPELDGWKAPRLEAADLDFLEAEARRLWETTDRAIIAPLGPPYELFYGLGTGGFEDWMVTFASEPDYVRRLYDELVTAWLENLEALHGAVGNRIQILQVNDDFGTQRAPFLSVRSFRELVMPAYQRGLDWIHQHTEWKVFLHSDGALGPLLPSLIEMGVDILNPVQTTAAGMDPRWLKREYGDRLAFWGGSCDCQGTLTKGRPEEVAAEVRAHLDALQPGSGHVFASVHNIQANVPAANIVTLFDTARDYRLPKGGS
ncbi:MAG: methyltransferase [Verrucomicrobiales bacterium]|nr:methyltransferase [Verrucomicrobiales bacterium]MCP5525390.1 methyltransferase [Verrucomicrobiales bacterium]